MLHKLYLLTFAILAVIAFITAACVSPPVTSLPPTEPTAAATLSPPPPTQAALPAGRVIWSQDTDGSCIQAAISLETLETGACGSQPTEINALSPQRAGELAEFGALFLAFNSHTLAGKIQFEGQGPVTATPSQQRMIAEWARLVYQETEAGGSDAARGLVLVWHQEGGIAGLCSDLWIYLDGRASAFSCKSSPPEALRSGRLISSQLSLVYDWHDRLHSFELSQTDLAAADSLTTQIKITGAGSIDALESDHRQMNELAQATFTELSLTANPGELEAAGEALVSYLTALSENRFTEAAGLFGGDIEVLRNNNPEIPPDDRAALFQAACERNGFICSLEFKNEVSAAQISSTVFRFIVELANRDGSLFILGPCCGEDPETQPPTTQFEFLVSLVEGKFLVQSLPVFSP